MRTLQEFLASLTPEQREEALKKYHDAIANPPEPSEALKKMFREFGRFAVQDDED